MAHGYGRRGPYEILESRVVYQNKWIRVCEDRVRSIAKRQPGLFGTVEMVAGSSVLPVADDGSVYLVKEYKYGIDRESVELISGALEKGETPLDAAKREMREETGLTASKWTNLGMVDPFTTVIRSPNYMFLAQHLTRGDRNPDDGEEVRVVHLSFDGALAMVLDGTLTHSASCVALLKTARALGR